MAGSISRLALEFLVIDGGSSALKGFARGVGEVGEAGQEAQRQLEGMAESWEKGLKMLATAGTIKEALIDPGIEAASSLQDVLAGLEVNLDPMSVDRMKRTLVDAQADAARIAAPTAFSQEQVIGVQTALKKAGLGFDAVLGAGGAGEAVAQLATGERGMSLEESQSSVVTGGSIFNLQGDQYAWYADILSRAGGAASTDPAALSRALAQAPSAGSLGLDPAETLAALGVMGNMGVQGGAAGTSLNAFLRQSAVSDKKFGFGMFEGGEFLGLVHAAEKLREAMEGRTDQERQIALQKAFGDEGARFALGLLRTDGGIESVMRSMEGARSLSDKVEILSGTHRATAGALAGSSRTALANLYAPLLEPLTGITAKANEAVGAIGTAAQEQEHLSKTVSYGSAALVGVAALAGGAYMAKGGAQGLGALRALGGGLASDAAGIAKGKAAAAAAGVTPVFVTNWPAGGLGGGFGGAAGAGAGAAGGLGARASTLGKAGLVGAAGLGGYGAGSLVQENLIKGTKAADVVQYFLSGMAGFNPLTGFTEAGKHARHQNFDYNASILEGTINKLSELFGSGLRLDVHVDNENNISWELTDGRTGREASRGEAA